MTRPVAIIGAGPVGISAAWYLAREGAEVVVLDRNRGPGLDTGSGSAGVVTPSHCVPLAGPKVVRGLPSWLMRRGMISVRLRPDPALARFGTLSVRAGRGELMLAGLRALRDASRASRELYAEIAELRPEVGFRRAGLMNVCCSEAGFEALAGEAELLRSEGFEPRLLPGAEAAMVEPTLRPDVAGGVFWEEDASLIPGEANKALVELAREAGAEIQMGAEVVGFGRGADGTVTEVHTAERVLPVSSVVLATGARTPALARQLGCRVPIQSAQGHHLDLPGWRSLPEVPMIFHEHAMGASALGSCLRLTGGMDFVGDDALLKQRRIDDIVRLAGDYLRDAPDPTAAAAGGAWCGMRPCSPDGLPIVGWTRRAPNAMIAAGHGMLGFTLGPATGRDVADLVLGVRRRRQEVPWLIHFSPARFGL